jgi:hypothetical protein
MHLNKELQCNVTPLSHWMDQLERGFPTFLLHLAIGL